MANPHPILIHGMSKDLHIPYAIPPAAHSHLPVPSSPLRSRFSCPRSSPRPTSPPPQRPCIPLGLRSVVWNRARPDRCDPPPTGGTRAEVEGVRGLSCEAYRGEAKGGGGGELGGHAMKNLCSIWGKILQTGGSKFGRVGLEKCFIQEMYSNSIESLKKEGKIWPLSS